MANKINFGQNTRQTNQVNANKHWAKHPSNQVNANKHISDEYYGFQYKRTLSGRKNEIS